MLSKILFIFGNLAGVFEGRGEKLIKVIQLFMIQHKSQAQVT